MDHVQKVRTEVEPYLSMKNPIVAFSDNEEIQNAMMTNSFCSFSSDNSSLVSNKEDTLSKALSTITRNRELVSEEDLAQAFMIIIESKVLHPTLQEAVEAIAQNNSVELHSKNKNTSSSSPKGDVFERLYRDTTLKHARMKERSMKKKVVRDRVMKENSRTKRSTHSSIDSNSVFTNVTSASTVSCTDSSFEQHPYVGAVKNDVYSRLYNARKVSLLSSSDSNDTCITAISSTSSQKKIEKLIERKFTKSAMREVYTRLYDNSSEVSSLRNDGKTRRKEIETLIAKRHEIPNFSDREKIPLSRASDFYYKCIKMILEADRRRSLAARERDRQYEPRYNFGAV